VKGKIVKSPCTALSRGGVEAYFHAFLTTALDGDVWSVPRPGRFTPWEEPWLHIEGLAGLRVSLDVAEKRFIAHTENRKPILLSSGLQLRCRTVCAVSSPSLAGTD
jgi:hypothetical protein